jgi:hypothetical protein
MYLLHADAEPVKMMLTNATRNVEENYFAVTFVDYLVMMETVGLAKTLVKSNVSILSAPKHAVFQ